MLASVASGDMDRTVPIFLGFPAFFLLFPRQRPGALGLSRRYRYCRISFRVPAKRLDDPQ
jgi:hypothetical protein